MPDQQGCVCAQVLEIAIRDSQITGRAAVGVVRVPLRRLPTGGQQNMWLPVQPSASGAKVTPGYLTYTVSCLMFQLKHTVTLLAYRLAKAGTIWRQLITFVCA